MNLTKPEFAEYVTNMRESVNLSQREFAELLGISITSMVIYEDATHPRLPRHLMEFIYDLQELVKRLKREERSCPERKALLQP
jgi:transcriptional regulator with XRE-family HTH domain